MGFEVFFQCFEQSVGAGISRTALRELFPIVLDQSEPDYWHIRYDEVNSCTISITTSEANSGLVTSLCVFRPCGSGLWDALLTTMKIGSMVLLFPGDGPPLVADAVTARQIPSDILEAFGDPVIVNSGQEIVSIIKRS